MITDINSEDRLVQKTFADHLRNALGWDSVYAYNEETFSPNGTLGRTSEREVVLTRDLRERLPRLNPDHSGNSARTSHRKTCPRRFVPLTGAAQPGVLSLHLRLGVPVEWRDDSGETSACGRR